MNISVPRRNSAVTPKELPLFYHSSSLTRYGAGGSTIATASSYFTDRTSTDGITRSIVSTAYTANIWYTIVNVSGASGRLINAESHTSSLTGSVVNNLRITLDGKVYLFTRSGAAALSAARILLGYYNAFSAFPATTGSTTLSEQVIGLPGSSSYLYNVGAGAGVLVPEHPLAVLGKYFRDLPTFKNSLKVETMCSHSSGGGADPYAACWHVLD